MSRTSKRITELEGELANARPYLGIAREIHDSVAQLAEQTDDMALVFEAAVLGVEERRRTEMVTAAFSSLPPTERLEKLAAIFGDSLITKALEAEREKELRRLAGIIDYEALKHEGARFNRFDPRNLPPGTLVRLGLSERSRLCTKQSGLEHSRILELVYEDDSQFRLTKDQTPLDVRKSETTLKLVPPLPGNTQVSLAHNDPAFGQREPTLYFGDAVEIIANNQPVYPGLCLGELHVGGQLIAKFRHP